MRTGRRPRNAVTWTTGRSRPPPGGRLRRLGAPVPGHFHSGTHHPAYGERELHHSLPMLLRAVGE
ncbi:hypothetical protein ABT063_33355 [Streptomyces sp. NPDC002838]|uniref:hypothetical protein n=1 Tax=Streptomyces sp. NPDC002838 TaxID=3154436 RepID=UPI003331B87A